MRLPPGSRLGRYEVVAHIGSGGMGDVYRARDTHLDRHVALKTIAAAYAHDPTSQPRFEREQHLSAALEHPHICRILDAGTEGSVHYLAMEYLDGESLAERLSRGSLPVAEAIGYAIEIADALQYAHSHGVVHRDLKPANVFLTRTGAKVLDFGLAKVWRDDAGARPAAMTGDTQRLDVTQPGAVVGSAPYMAPERLEGHEADHRTDVFGFGVLLYEMLTGRRAFAGHAPLAAILAEDPPPLGLKHQRAPDLEWIVRKCLAKKADDRWQSMADVQAVLRRLAGTGLAAGPPPPRRRGVLVAAVLLPLLVAAVFAWIAWRQMREAARSASPIVVPIVPPPNGAFTPTQGSVQTAQFALAPDGSAIAFVAAGSDGISRIWVQRFASVLPVPIAGTEDAVFPFWALDRPEVGFFAREMLRRVDVNGGPPQTIAPARSGRGGTWNAAGEILFAPNIIGTIMRVPATGGTATEVTALDASRGEMSHRWPWFLPDGRRFLYFARSDANPDAHGAIYLKSLDGGPATLVANSNVGGVFLPPNRILYTDVDRLLAREINLSDGKPLSDPVIVAENVGVSSAFYGAFSASATGAIAYASEAMTSDLLWLDRAGRPTGAPASSGEHVDFRISPNGDAVAIAELDADTNSTDIFVLDLRRGERNRMTESRATDASPVWSPDGSGLLFRSNRGGVHDLYVIDTDHPDEQTLLQKSQVGKYPTSWARDGRIAFHTGQTDEKWNVFLADARPGATLERYLKSQFIEVQAQFSPDGKWIAYTSNDTGTYHVWVQPVNGGKPRQVSLHGGGDPRWRPDGTELFYVSLTGQLTAVPVTLRRDAVELGTAQTLFAVSDGSLMPPFTSIYDVSRDGRFLVRRLRENVRSTPLRVLLNWPLESKR